MRVKQIAGELRNRVCSGRTAAAEHPAQVQLTGAVEAGEERAPRRVL